jgi:hypothetical protein
VRIEKIVDAHGGTVQIKRLIQYGSGSEARQWVEPLLGEPASSENLSIEKTRVAMAVAQPFFDQH